jgi:succinate-semialdehyde dehydrogenase / glutarate-semialdehyde dehydrogenase
MRRRRSFENSRSTRLTMTTVPIYTSEHFQWPPHLTSSVLDALGGQVVSEGEAESLFDVRAPFTNASIGSLPQCSPADVEAAAIRARRAQPAWEAHSLKERSRMLLRVHDYVLANRERIMDLIQLESGKTRKDAFEEIADTALVSRYYGFHGPRHLRPRRRRGAIPLLTRTHEVRHPLGVVGIISPWNYPLVMALNDALPALMAGNAVILKPAEQSSFTALESARILSACGLPDGLFQVVTGAGAVLCPPLIREADFISFTGSTETGRLVAEQAAREIKRFSLELGGKNPMIVLADADVDRAVDGAVRGSFSNGGQLCVAFERIYVAEPIYEAFMHRLVDRTRRLRLDAGYGFGGDVGSLVSDAHLAKVERHVADARDRGATVHCGGRPRPDVGPLFYEPTVVTGVSEDMLLAREETFGPVVAVYPFDGEDEAVERANDSRYGLNASVWTGDTRHGRAVAQRIQAGTVNVNDSYAAAWSSVDAPMGGFKQSGVGRRHGADGILKYTEVQTVAVQHFHSIAPPAGMSEGTFARAAVRLLRLMRRLPGLR